VEEALSIMSKKHNRRYKQERQTKEERIRRDKAGAFEFMQKINFILAKIRETNIGMMETKPSTDPSKQSISNVIFPPEGGVMTHFDGLEHPAKGFCYGETVETVDEVKKTVMSFLTGFYDGLRESKIKMVLFVLLFRKQFIKIFITLIEKLDYRMRRVRQKPEMYCICAREVYRAFNLMMIWYPDWKSIVECIRNIICMVLEYDDAYRYPFQDVVPELDKDACRKDVIGEIKRLLDIEVKWDHRSSALKFKRIEKLIFLLKFNKKLKEAVKRFLLELDLDKIKMDEDDRFHAKFKWGYNWDHIKNYDPRQKPKKEEEKKEEKEKVHK